MNEWLEYLLVGEGMAHRLIGTQSHLLGTSLLL